MLLLYWAGADIRYSANTKREKIPKTDNPENVKKYPKIPKKMSKTGNLENIIKCQKVSKTPTKISKKTKKIVKTLQKCKKL